MGPQTNDKPQMRLSGFLECGAKIEIYQEFVNSNIEITVTPAPGIPIQDTADFKDDKLRVRLTVDSFLGVYQLMNLAIFPDRPKQIKKFSLTKFLFGV